MSKEIEDFRIKGKIADNFAEKKYGFKSWVELFTILDEETPDEDRLDALKAMFYAVNRMNVEDGEKILNYQLFQLTKQLSSGQLLLLKVVRDMKRTVQHAETLSAWKQKAAQLIGHGVVGLVSKDVAVLASLGLVESLDSDHSVLLSDIGSMFCNNIETYHTDLKK